MFQIELRSDVPIYEQIVRQVKSLVVRGVLRPGDPMPSIRKLAESMRTNPNTVARAYQELERLGMIENWVGRGAFVCDQPGALVAEASRQKALDGLQQPLIELMLAGLTRAEILAEVGAVLHRLKGEEG